MSEDRKATDILLSIESDVKEILAHQRNSDLKNGIILERLRILSENMLTHSPVQTPSVTPTLTVSAPDTAPKAPVTQMPAAPAVPAFDSSNLRDKLRKAMSDAKTATEEIEFKDVTVENTQSGKRRGTRVQTNAEKQVSVQQRVVDADTKNIFMAKVEIFDIDKNPIKQTKTNQAGKWFAQLLPGKYTIALTKTGTPVKAPIAVTYGIDVPEQDENLELETKQV